MPLSLRRRSALTLIEIVRRYCHFDCAAHPRGADGTLRLFTYITPLTNFLVPDDGNPVELPN